MTPYVVGWLVVEAIFAAIHVREGNYTAFVGDLNQSAAVIGFVFSVWLGRMLGL